MEEIPGLYTQSVFASRQSCLAAQMSMASPSNANFILTDTRLADDTSVRMPYRRNDIRVDRLDHSSWNFESPRGQSGTIPPPTIMPKTGTMHLHQEMQIY